MSALASLEQFDKQLDHVHSTADYALTCERLATRPESLGPRDIAILRYFGGERRAAAAIAARDLQAPPAGSHARVLTTDDLAKIANSIVAGITFAVAPLQARIGSLEMRVVETKAATPDRVVVLQREGAAAADVAPQIAALDARIKALETRPLLKWAGVHVDGQKYPEAQLVTRSGGLWVSTGATDATPGTPGASWRLVVKSGARP